MKNNVKGFVLPGKLLVKQSEGRDKTEGGIIIPDSYNEKPFMGEVVITGESTKRIEMVVGVGDTVYWPDHAGTLYEFSEPELELRGEYILINQTDVLFIKRTN